MGRHQNGCPAQVEKQPVDWRDQSERHDGFPSRSIIILVETSKVTVVSLAGYVRTEHRQPFATNRHEKQKP